MKIFVYGATGMVGQALVQNLLDAGHTVIAGTRRPEAQKSRPGLRWTRVESMPETSDGQDNDPARIAESLSGVDSVFLMSPPGYTDQHGLLFPWIAAAKTAGVKKIVLMTAMGIEGAPPEVPFRKLELALIESGVTYTILRPNWFMQNFFTFWLAGIARDRKIYFPGGDARTSFVDARDIAGVAGVALDPSRHQNAELAVTGPTALTHAEVADIISATTKIPIQYDDISATEFESQLLSAGLPADYAAFLVQIAADLKAGRAAPVAPTVAELTGNSPRDFASFTKDYQSMWS